MNTMSNNGQKIERKMRKVRREIEQDAGQLVASTRELTDWRRYVRAHPWLCLGGAAALGMLLVPGRSVASKDASPVATATAAGAGGTLLGLIGRTVGRTALTVATRTAADLAASHVARRRDTVSASPKQESES